MPQNPLSAAIAKTVAGAFALLNLDAVGNLLTTKGGKSTALNVTAAAAVATGARRIAKVVIVAPGSTSGAFTINDSATTGGAAAANVLWSLPYNSSLNVAGQVFDLDLPCANGITVSAVPGGGSPILAISYS